MPRLQPALPYPPTAFGPIRRAGSGGTRCRPGLQHRRTLLQNAVVGGAGSEQITASSGSPKMDKVHIELPALSTPIIIAAASTNVVYGNQVNSVACDYRRLEGFLLPLPPINAQFFRPSWWERTHNHRVPGDREHDEFWSYITGEMERAVEAVISTEGGLVSFHVIDEASNVEAWVQVTFQLEEDEVEFRGVLTWQNCD
jgi:Family of unknown function (DUF6210)